MQIILNISEEDYTWIKDHPNCAQTLGSYIANSKTISDDATNGDAIKALFPNITVVYLDNMVEVYRLSADRKLFREDWWNAPYKKGVKAI